MSPECALCVDKFGTQVTNGFCASCPERRAVHLKELIQHIPTSVPDLAQIREELGDRIIVVSPPPKSTKPPIA